MSSNKNNINILTNVFHCVGANRLQLVDLVFSDKIEQIRPRLDQVIHWQEIATAEKWQQFQRQVQSRLPDAPANGYDGTFLLVIPGAIDTHVHFNTPGFEDRDDFDHGSLAAAYGGVTTVIDMPCTSLPPVTSVENLMIKQAAIQGRSRVDYGFWGGVNGNDFAAGKNINKQINELAEAGVVGFKVYLVSGMPTFADLTAQQLRQVAEFVQPTGLPLAVHAEDKATVLKRTRRYQKMGRNDWRAYCNARDQKAEARAVMTMISIARSTGCPIHLVHLSSKLGLEAVRAAQEEGLCVTAETCPHYLFFTREDFTNRAISAFLKTAPPVKTASDREALRQGLQDGTIAFVTTDHAGCNPEQEKSAENFWQVYGGIPGVEQRVPFLLSEEFLNQRLTLAQTIDLLSTQPARFCRLTATKGSIEPGKDADLALINLWEQQVIRAQNMHSKGKYTPFEGVKFNAVVETTFLRGKVVMNRRKIGEEKVGWGQQVVRNGGRLEVSGNR